MKTRAEKITKEIKQGKFPGTDSEHFRGKTLLKNQEMREAPCQAFPEKWLP